MDSKDFEVYKKSNSPESNSGSMDLFSIHVVAFHIPVTIQHIYYSKIFIKIMNECNTGHINFKNQESINKCVTYKPIYVTITPALSTFPLPSTLVLTN